MQWFYIGQIRFRYHLAANPDLEPSGDPALFGSLSQVVGAPLNQYAFGDISKLAETIDQALAWDESHHNGFTPKDKDPQKYEAVRAGLVKMKTEILSKQDEIKEQRKAHGLD